MLDYLNDYASLKVKKLDEKEKLGYNIETITFHKLGLKIINIGGNENER